jgi:hypothetical protein
VVWEDREYRLLLWSAASQAETADLPLIKMDFATPQTMEPTRADAETLSKQVDVAAFVGTSNEDDLRAQGSAEIEGEPWSIGWRRGATPAKACVLARCSLALPTWQRSKANR